MPTSIKMEAVPSQLFTSTLGGNNYNIKIFSTDGAMAYDLSIDDEIIVQGFQLVNEVLMIPYKHQEVNGNLLLVVPDDETPNYKSFGVTQFLAYLTTEESEVYRGSLDD